MLKTVARSLFRLYKAYLAVCLLLLLPALNVLAPRLVEEHTGRVLHSELLLFNPFSLTADLRGVALLDGDGERFISFERLQLNLSLATLWQPGIVLDELSVRGLGVDVRRFADGSFNFSDLLASEDSGAETASEDTAPLPAITIHRVAFGAHHLRFSDATRTPVFDSAVADIDLRASELSTVRSPAGDYRFSLHTPENGQLDWRGELSLAGAYSRGRLTLAEVDLRPVHRYFAQDLAFALDGARLDISGQYSADWSGQPLLRLEQGTLRLHGVSLNPLDTAALPDTALGLRALALTGISIDSAAQTVGIEDIHLEAPAVAGFSDEGTHSLLVMLGVPLAAEDERGEVPAPPPTGPATQDAADPWQLSVAQLRLTEGRLHWRSPYTRPALSRIAPVDAQISDLSWPPQNPSALTLALGLNSESTLNLEGTLHPGDGNGTLDLGITGLALPMFDPAVALASNASLDSGILNTQLRVELDAFAPQRISADSRIDALEVGIRGLRDNALGWQSLRIEGSDINLASREADIGAIALDGYHGRVHILEDGRINVQLALNSESAEPRAETPEDETVPGPAAAPEETEGEHLGGWRVRSAGLALSDMRIDFRDDSMPLPFDTQIGEISGSLGALDSRASTRTPLRISGKADGYAPVSLEGELAPLAEQSALDLGLSFSGLDIARFSPYSVTYAGRRIDAGTLNLDVRYQLEGNALQGDNHAVISQMRLGEKVESEGAIDLPLELALALLTDARGVIDLDIPVSGDVDNPSFSLGKVIGGALRNLITKAVTAPFRLLAGLVGSDRDLQHIGFAAGSAELGEEARQTLATLADALAQRPQLRMLATGQVLPEADLPPLRLAQLEQQLRDSGLGEASIAARDTAWAEAIAARYAALPAVASPEQAADTAEAVADPAAQLEAVLQSIGIEENTLRELASARAAAIKRELVEHGSIAAERIAISAPDISGVDAIAGVLLDVAS